MIIGSLKNANVIACERYMHQVILVTLNGVGQTGKGFRD